jgi:hypothetical protein
VNNQKPKKKMMFVLHALIGAISFLVLSVHALHPVNLGSAGHFVILSKAGISTVPSSVITGNIGVSPIARGALTGFSQTLDSTKTFSTSPQVTGKMYAADYVPPTPRHMTGAIGDMNIAYNDAKGRVGVNFTELASGALGGLTLVPGLYKWSSSVGIATSVTLDGSPTDVWIFQIAGDVTQAANTRVLLAGGALAKNIFWQVEGFMRVQAQAHMEGIVLCFTAVHFMTGASLNGRIYAHTAVTLDQSTITESAVSPTMFGSYPTRRPKSGYPTKQPNAGSPTRN